jgi:hypothetical protein
VRVVSAARRLAPIHSHIDLSLVRQWLELRSPPGPSYNVKHTFYLESYISPRYVKDQYTNPDRNRPNR